MLSSPELEAKREPNQEAVTSLLPCPDHKVIVIDRINYQNPSIIEMI